MTNNGRTWEIACAQLCGLGHYRMRGILSVDTRADFDQFLKDTAEETAAMFEENAPPPENPVPEATPAEPLPTTTGNAHT